MMMLLPSHCTVSKPGSELIKLLGLLLEGLRWRNTDTQS